MQEIELIPVTKDGEYIEVHPSTLGDHKRLGWVECARQDGVEEPEAQTEPKKRGRAAKA